MARPWTPRVSPPPSAAFIVWWKGLLESGAIDLHTTYFETVTAMALLLFAEERTDMVVLEVGLGGRLDATNVVRPELCVVTPIDFDHEAFLGRGLESIAGEKAGILKPGVPAVFARQRPEVGTGAGRARPGRGAPVARTSGWKIRGSGIARPGARFSVGRTFSDPRATQPGLFLECPLAGEHQVENAVTAALALHSLGVPDPAIQAGIAAVRWPGRLECVSEKPEIILDGAHNPASLASPRRLYRAFLRRIAAVRLIYGAMRDKAVAEMGGILFPLAAEVILTAPRQARAIEPEALRSVADHPNLRVAPHLEDALAIPPGDSVTFIAGSLYLVAEARAILVNQKSQLAP